MEPVALKTTVIKKCSAEFSRTDNYNIAVFTYAQKIFQSVYKLAYLVSRFRSAGAAYGTEVLAHLNLTETKLFGKGCCRDVFGAVFGIFKIFKVDWDTSDCCP